MNSLALNTQKPIIGVEFQLKCDSKMTPNFLDGGIFCYNRNYPLKNGIGKPPPIS
jgi:hypothetical protein